MIHMYDLLAIILKISEVGHSGGHYSLSLWPGKEVSGGGALVSC